MGYGLWREGSWIDERKRRMGAWAQHSGPGRCKKVDGVMIGTATRAVVQEVQGYVVKGGLEGSLGE